MMSELEISGFTLMGVILLMGLALFLPVWWSNKKRSKDHKQ